MSRKILIVQSSARLQGSYSRQLVQEFVALLQARGGPHPLTDRDLVAQPLPVLQPGVVEAIRTPREQLSAEQHHAAALSEQLIGELQAADVIAIGAPMYNWSIPAALKAWLDQVMRIGFTFGYGAHGLEGLLHGKRTLVVISRGGAYQAPERALIDMQKPYLDRVLRVMGLQPEFVIAEGTLGDPAALDACLATARNELRCIADRFSAG